LLGNHGINFDMANRDINTLSGGEQTKVRLALLRHQKGNVLILDEPTNHLDVNAKEALKEALMSYEGTLILVSHEKEFYQDICDYEISLYDV
ncbi:MAG: ATP-binding cassette domain-containing protein, partial [Acholeplasmataceae bacterium]|nr:ATP-binding cassette domain-containing protein [Acholeplasmataceae bacterium]